MDNSKTRRTFIDLFDSGRSSLKVKFDVNSAEEATEIQIKNKLDTKVDKKGLIKLKEICSDTRLSSFIDFYSNYNGFSLGKIPKRPLKKPLLEQLPVSVLAKFTSRYLPNGKLAWIMDLNKSKPLYRGEHKWLAFAQVEAGPSCLTIFLEGEHAGNIFYATPQPHFNILKPIAKTHQELLDRIADDPAAFFKLIKAYVTMTRKDGMSYGYVPVEYMDGK